jgi:hypothetical protein
MLNTTNPYVGQFKNLSAQAAQAIANGHEVAALRLIIRADGAILLSVCWHACLAEGTHETQPQHASTRSSESSR